jgi:hypothetical protein
VCRVHRCFEAVKEREAGLLGIFLKESVMGLTKVVPTPALFQHLTMLSYCTDVERHTHYGQTIFEEEDAIVL